MALLNPDGSEFVSEGPDPQEIWGIYQDWVRQPLPSSITTEQWEKIGAFVKKMGSMDRAANALGLTKEEFASFFPNT